MQDISVIIPSHKRSKQLKELLKSIPENVEVIVVKDNIPLSAKRQKGWKKAKGKYILFIDDDNVLERNAISAAVKYLKNELFFSWIDIVGFMAKYQSEPDKVCSCGSFRRYWTGFTLAAKPDFVIKEVDEVANAFMVKKSVLEEVGGFDCKRFPIDLDEADLCYRIKKAGYKVAVTTQAVCYHNHHISSRIPNFRRHKNAYYMARNRILFQKKHNLSLLFTPVFIASYIFILVVRGKFIFIKHFLKGVLDGFKSRTKSPKEYQM